MSWFYNRSLLFIVFVPAFTILNRINGPALFGCLYLCFYNFLFRNLLKMELDSLQNEIFSLPVAIIKFNIDNLVHANITFCLFNNIWLILWEFHRRCFNHIQSPFPMSSHTHPHLPISLPPTLPGLLILICVLQMLLDVGPSLEPDQPTQHHNPSRRLNVS